QTPRTGSSSVAAADRLGPHGRVAASGLSMRIVSRLEGREMPSLESDGVVIAGLQVLLAGAAALASFGALRAWTRLSPGKAWPYLAVLAASASLSWAVHRRIR